MNRIIYFPIVAIYPESSMAYHLLMNNELVWEGMVFCMVFNSSLLAILAVMHVYWFSHFILIIYNKVCKKKNFNDAAFVEKK